MYMTIRKMALHLYAAQYALKCARTSPILRHCNFDARTAFQGQLQRRLSAESGNNCRRTTACMAGAPMRVDLEQPEMATRRHVRLLRRLLFTDKYPKHSLLATRDRLPRDIMQWVCVSLVIRPLDNFNVVRFGNASALNLACPKHGCSPYLQS